jgi:hypothetical protein
MRQLLEPGSVDVVVTSPPYNIGVNYNGYDDTIPREEYLDWMEEWGSAVKQALSDDGSLTGRGAPLMRGFITGLMTTLGGIGHTLPFLVPDTLPNAFLIATSIAVFIVLVAISDRVVDNRCNAVKRDINIGSHSEDFPAAAESPVIKVAVAIGTKRAFRSGADPGNKSYKIIGHAQNNTGKADSGLPAAFCVDRHGLADMVAEVIVEIIIHRHTDSFHESNYKFLLFAE